MIKKMTALLMALLVSTNALFGTIEVVTSVETTIETIETTETIITDTVCGDGFLVDWMTATIEAYDGFNGTVSGTMHNHGCTINWNADDVAANGMANMTGDNAIRVVRKNGLVEGYHTAQHDVREGDQLLLPITRTVETIVEITEVEYAVETSAIIVAPNAHVAVWPTDLAIEEVTTTVASPVSSASSALQNVTFVLISLFASILSSTHRFISSAFTSPTNRLTSAIVKSMVVFLIFGPTKLLKFVWAPHWHEYIRRDELYGGSAALRVSIKNIDILRAAECCKNEKRKG